MNCDFGGRAMRCFGVISAVVSSAFVGSVAKAGVVIETVTVGNPGNAGELSGEGAGGMGLDRICGAVDYVYNIDKFEITAGQYTEFLNAVAAVDTYGLYDEHMGDPLTEDVWGCNIQRGGTSGSYTYSVASDWGNRPVNYVSWGDAARFANWLHNGQPTGAQVLGTTEDGSYLLNGATSNEGLTAVMREEGATWVIPSEDEWHKAAYHKNDGVTGEYFDFPTSSDSVPANDLVEPSDPGNNATFYDAQWPDPVGWTIGSPYYRTEAGAHENSESPYGTLDQGGNVWEWNESVFYGWARGIRGGSFSFDDITLDGATRVQWVGSGLEGYDLGFRVAYISEPATLALLALGGVTILGKKRR
ncbi:MAG: SUMF1/EgtB/PvdO family nonheme iron enzyme [Planctomycetes bacterium]|nr:SUMF1/EgtB/PvdO family nonheme iron enzyme [Planctomycetota bacterium]